VTDFWFNTLHREVLRAPKARDNDGSRKISMNSGMRLIRVEKQQFAGILDAGGKSPGGVEPPGALAVSARDQHPEMVWGSLMLARLSDGHVRPSIRQSAPSTSNWF
jgi:hypothetical protein